MRNATEETTILTGADIGVVIGYFILVILVGALAMWKANRSTVTGYFLAGRSMWFLPIGASLFVSNIGTEHFIGLSGSGAAQGIAVGAWEFNALMLLQVLGWIFVPVYIACGVCTMPEYLSKRFGGTRLRTYFAILSLVLYIFTKCSGDLYTGALFIQQSLKWDLYVSILTLIIITAALTLTGGLTAVIYTDTLQAFLMVGGALYLMGVGFSEVGGFQGLLEKYPQAVPTKPEAIVPNTTCHYPDKKAFTMLREVDDDYTPWLGFLLGQTPGSIWYWCTDQVIVQRALAAKSISHAQGATIMAGFIKILPLFMMVMPGMISRVLYPNEVACTNPDYCMEVCQSKAGCTNIAYPKLVLGLMPEGARGLMMAVMIAALMSDLDSIFNSASTLFTMDVWRKFRKRASNTELMVVGRLFIIVMVGLSVAWIPVIKETQRGQVFIYIQEVTNYLAPPFAAIFLLGILCPFVNEQGVFWSLMFALLIGVVRLFSVMILKGEEYCGSQDQYPEPPILSDFHYMYFSFFITALTAVAAVVISLCGKRPDDKLLCRTTFWTRHSKDHQNTEEIETIEMGHHDYEAHETHAHHFLEKAEFIGARNEKIHPDEKRNSLIKYHPNPDIVEEPTVKVKVIRFLCGVKADDSDFDDEHTKQMKEHLLQLSDLKQSRWELIILNTMLVIVVSVGLFMFIFWSVYDFQPAPTYPDLPTTSSLAINGLFLTNHSNAIV